MEKLCRENYSTNEIISLVYSACKAARELESNLTNLANNPNLLHKSCEEVIQLFANARDRLIMTDDYARDQDPMMFSDQGHPHHASSSQSLQPPNPLLPEWLRFSSSSQPPVDIHHVIHTPRLLGGKSPAPENKIPAGEIDHEMAMAGGGLRVLELGGRATSMDTSTTFTSAIGDIQLLNSAATRRRKHEAERETRFVPAPRVGNTEIPPEDGYTWRKYGQKDILNSRFPRAYYRCTHQKTYGCPAKKQVQRLDHDPYTYEVTYKDHHTCHMSSTAPSVAPPPPLPPAPPPPPPPPASFSLTCQEMIQTTIGQQLAPASISMSSVDVGKSWLSMELKPAGSEATVNASYLIDSCSLHIYDTSSSSSAAGPSTTTTTVRYGREAAADQYPVVDLADVMFNSGSSSNNSMDLIFPSAEDKWEDERRNIN